MKMQRTPRYTLPGPCMALIFQGRDGRWYRVCVPCDTLIPAGGKLPSHLGYGWPDAGNAAMSVRDHVRQMDANRHAHKRRLERERNLVWAAMRGDILLFGQLIMGEADWKPGDHLTEEEAKVIMDDYLARRDH